MSASVTFSPVAPGSAAPPVGIRRARRIEAYAVTGVDLFDEREQLAWFWLGQSMWAELHGDIETATIAAGRASFIARELARAAGL